MAEHIDRNRIEEIKLEVEGLLDHVRSSKAPHPDAQASAGQDLARYFDHTLLKPDATHGQFRDLCSEAAEVRAFSVCVPPNRVRLAVDELSGSQVKTCTVVGFPLGYATPASKAAEVAELRELGCHEFDTVIPVGKVKEGNWNALYEDVAAVVDAASGKLVKVILETALLTPYEIAAAGYVALRAGADMLKTSTGFASGGASVEAVRIMRLVAGDVAGVKASGGIRELSFTKELIEAGADRIGASSTLRILEEAGSHGV